MKEEVSVAAREGSKKWLYALVETECA